MRRLTPWLRQSKTRNHRARLHVSPLEAREVPAAVLANGVLTVTGDNPGIGDQDTIEILSPADGQMVVRVNGQQQFSGSVAISRVEIDGQAGVDTVTIRGVQSGIAGGVHVRNSEIVGLGDQVPGTGLQTMTNIRSFVDIDRAAIVNLRDTASTANRTVTVSNLGVTGLSPATIGYDLGPEAILTIRSGSGAETFDIGGTPQALTRVFGGAGADTFDVQRWFGNVEVIGEAGTDTVTIGPAGIGFGQTLGTVRVTDGSFRDQVTVLDDQAASGADFFNSYQATLTSTQLDVRVNATSVLGNRVIPVGFNRIINLDAVGALDYRAPAARANTSQIDIRSQDRFTDVRVDAGGTERVRVGSTAGSLNPVMGRLTIAGGVDTGRLVLDDSGATLGRSFRVGASQVTYPDPQLGNRTINYANYLGVVHVDGGSGADRFTVDSLRTGNRWVLVDGNAGTDIVVGREQGSRFGVLGQNTGSVDSQVDYFSAEILVGRAGDDTFRFFDNGTIGTIDGGGGFDTLDYSTFDTPVAVSLAAGTATNVLNRATNLRNVFGGSAADRLTGNASNNVLVGNGGNDILDGTRLGRDVLIGGTGADDLSTPANRAGALFVGGDVAEADRNNVTSMKAIMTEWQSSAGVDTRVANLAAGVGPGGTVRLSAETLDGDGAADVFRGNLAADAFYREFQDLFTGSLPAANDRVITV
jgi:hypothetical protein